MISFSYFHHIHCVRGVRVLAKPAGSTMSGGFERKQHHGPTSMQVRHLLRLHHRPTNPHEMPCWSPVQRGETSLRLQMACEMQAQSSM